MAENDSFFRKVARFVANPTTEWSELGTRPPETREVEIEKSELRAMVERRKRNDFVRKREFDMLRKVRREGLTPEQLASLGPSSRLDDSRLRGNESRPAPAEHSVKAKIDAIEQQMTGTESALPSTRRATGFADAATEPAVLARFQASTHLHSATPPVGIPKLPDPPPGLDFELPPTTSAAPVVMAKGLPPLASLIEPPLPPGPSGSMPLDADLGEPLHDAELDEAVIAFANADFSQCERALVELTGEAGSRADHADTWLVLFDLYRATGQQRPFETLAIEFAQRFGRSAPQWFSLPHLVSEAVAEEHKPAPRAGVEVGWQCPALLDPEAVASLRSQTLQMRLPWAFDWSALTGIEAEAATQLSALFRVWGGQSIELHWFGAERLDSVLREAAPAGVRDADPAFWLLRLDMLRLANRADQFDEAAMDYCVTYEVSPPAWEPARCTVRFGQHGQSAETAPMSLVSDVSTSFLDSGLNDHAPVMVATIELSGQLLGDIGATLTRLNQQLGNAPLVKVSCSRLIRVDFPAAGDLLNWVLSRRGENRAVSFVDAHRLVALFFGAMGINEHARVQLRKD